MGPKWCQPIRLQDFKSNISLEKNDEIVYFCVFYMFFTQKNIGVSVVRNGCSHPGSQGEWMN